MLDHELGEQGTVDEHHPQLNGVGVRNGPRGKGRLSEEYALVCLGAVERSNECLYFRPPDGVAGGVAFRLDV